VEDIWIGEHECISHGNNTVILPIDMYFRSSQSEVLNLISGFHRALLQSITFIIRLMQSITQNLEVKIYVV